MHIPLEIRDRFWDKVKIGPKCWDWQAHRNKKGYGQFRFNGKVIRAHRFAWLIATGSLPEDKCVLHKCDNPTCVRFDHLFLGTNADNVADRNTKNRQARPQGEDNGQAKLTDEEVLTIRVMKGTQQAIAKCFGTSQQQVSKIKNRQTWKHL